MTITLLRGQSAPVGPYTLRVVRVEGQHVVFEVTGPATTADVRAAAERYADNRVRAHASMSANAYLQFYADMRLLADAYLALASPPPAGGEGDDGEALTVDWLLSVKFERVDGFPRPCLRRGSFLHICPPCGKLGWWLTLDVDLTEIRLPTPQVRGDVRRLLSALGMAHDRAADAPRRRGGEERQP